jgi:glycosyltransferase involved in cell wall biosynthesis
MSQEEQGYRPRVCYLGAYDPAYPRNQVLRRGLTRQGATVVDCRVSPTLKTVARMRSLRQQYAAIAAWGDVILLAEFNQTLAPFAWWMARRHRKRLVVDAFTSLYDSAVHDRATAHPRSPNALRYWFADWLAIRLADLALFDTAQHRDYFVHTFGVSPRRCVVIPVGAPQEWFETPPVPHGLSGTLALFYGTYIPLHGVETILRAAHHLRKRTDIHFELVGRGQTYPAAQELATDLKLERVTFREPVTPTALPGLVARADVCLGVFGTSAKASRVVPNKVYQTLALGKPLITADTPALRDAFMPGEHLLAVPPGDAKALAEAITSLADNLDLRDRLGQAGRTRTRIGFNEAALGQRLLEALQK